MKRTPFRRKRRTADEIERAKVQHITEAQFQRNVEEIAFANGWLTFHASQPFWDTAGLPDLILVRERIEFWELKVRDAKKSRAPSPSPVQWRFMDRLVEAGGIVRLMLWPDDWDEIVRLLAREGTTG